MQEEEVAEYESSDENEDDDDEFGNQYPSDVHASSSGKIMWRKTWCPSPAGEFTSITGPSQEILDLEDPTPHDVCWKFITKEVIKDIFLQTNLYAQQKGKGYKPTDENEIKTFIGMNLLMGIVRLPSYRDYWSSNPCLHNDFISKLMPVNRFGWLLGNIHLDDNTLMPDRKSADYDKLYKIRPFMKAMQENFERHFLPSCNVALDELMITFKGHSSMKQYLPNKPIKRGYKVWMMADNSGYCLKFDIYTGKTENKVTKDLGAKVVSSLVESLEGKEHKVYFDNYFTSVDLMKKLKDKGVNACGTVKPSRRDLPTFKSSKTMSRGDTEIFTSNTGISATKWRDKKDVFLLTNFHDPKEMSEVARKEKDGTRKLYPCPISIIEYNNNMNSVDKFGQLLALYKLDRRSKKWWHRIFFYFLDAAVVNSYLLYKALQKSIKLKEFKIQCVQGLLAARLVERKRASTSQSPLQIKKSKPTVSVEIRRKESSHQPQRGTRRRCALCTTKAKEALTDWVCSVCQVPLCLGKSKECFQKYHA